MRGVEIKAWSSVGCGLLCIIALSGCGTRPAPSATNQNVTGTVETDTVQELQRQIRERDKRIAELTSQLEALKLIDQDRQRRTPFPRPPATLTPIE
jgi:hypothetical protein